MIVVDIDSQTAHDHVKKSGGHAPGPMVQSPRENGGLHLYFQHPGFYVKNAVNLGGVDGLDVRGDGGIVVIPPSPDHKSGRAYEWVIPPEDAKLPKCPPWLLEMLKNSGAHKPSLDVPHVMSGVPEGQRDQELNRLAGKLRQMNVQQDIAVTIIETAAGNCKPPFPKAEARAKVKWAYAHYAPGEDLQAVLKLKRTPEEESADEGVFTADVLMGRKFNPVRWIVPGLLPQGSMLFAGKPKMGKSWMVLGFCLAIATGGKALGEFECEVGDALYMALEDNPRRLQSRLKDLLDGPSRGPGGLERLSMTVKSKKLDAGLIPEIQEWLEDHPEARIVVIDTLGSVRGGKPNDNRTLYEQDYEIGSALTALAEHYGVCILIVHHLRKGDADDIMDMVSGSTGLTGGMDGAMVLNRTRSAADGILKAVHRDLEDDPEMALQKVDAGDGWWKYAGDAEEYRLGQDKTRILEILSNADGPMRPRDIADEMGKKANTVSQILAKLKEAGYVDARGYGQYILAPGQDGPAKLDLGGVDKDEDEDGMEF
jgi:hypothetical protein